MANRFFSPDQQFMSNSGVPYAGGFLYFYATGTSTPQNTYSDSALTIANTNPVVLDSNGQAGSVFLQNLAYKVVLADSNNNQVWTMDPVYSSDYSTFAAFKPWNGNPNGFVAGTAGTVGTLPGTSAVWDYVNNQLYICTVTGNAATAVWISLTSNTTIPVVVAPQGYLTLNPNVLTPIMDQDFTSTTVYYSPYSGNQIPIFNGSGFVNSVFSQLNLTLNASHAASTIYDVFVFSNAGVLTMVTGPAWASSTAGSGSRGSGGGSTQLTKLNGMWVNAVQINGRNGVTTYVITANSATYVGSIYIDTTPGQVSCTITYGQSRKWGVWNGYNRANLILKAGDPTSSWTLGTSGMRPANNNVANSIITLCGLPEESFDLSYSDLCGSNGAIITTASTMSVNVGVAVNAAVLGRIGTFSFSNQTTSNALGTSNVIIANYIAPPTIGTNLVGAYESNNGGVVNAYFGNQSGMLLLAKWRG